jgi:hypothetical protein
VRDEHSRIDQRSFDGLLERFLTEHGTTFVVDNGASTFLPLWPICWKTGLWNTCRSTTARSTSTQ